jgi:hypothetical protein
MEEVGDLKRLPLLPWQLKYVGVFLLLVGAVGVYFFIHLGKKPQWLEWNVFTLYSQYISTKIFALIRNNQGDELSVLLYFIGAFMLIFSAERKEKSGYNVARLRAFYKTVALSMVIFVAGYMMLHGMAIIVFTAVMPFIVPLIYLALFYVSLRRY